MSYLIKEMKLIIIVLMFDKVYSVNHEKKGINPAGPFYIPELDIPKMTISRHSTSINVYVVPNEIEVLMVTCRAWRKARNWKFFASYHYEQNSYVVVPTNEEAVKWIEEGGVYIGDDYIDSSDDYCWTSLDKMDRKVFNKDGKKLNPVEPSATAFKSKCTTTWSVEIHRVKFPVYFKWNTESNVDSYRVIFYGPTGTEFRIDSQSSVAKVVKMEDTVMTYKTIVHQVIPTVVKGMCLDSYCIVTYEKGTMSLKFENSKSEYQNYGFKDVKSTPSGNVRTLLKNNWRDAPAADSVTFQDYRTLISDLDYELKLLEETRISLQLESARINNLMKAVVSSVSKIDDQLIGEILGRPMRSKWINHEDFLLYNSFEMGVGLTERSKNNNCVGSYIFKGGRWKLNEGKQGDCFDWIKAKPIFVIAPLSMANINYTFDFTDFRKSDNSYDGWTYLDDGKASLDDFDSKVRDKPGASLFGDLNFSNNLLFYIEVAGLIIGIIFCIMIISNLFKAVR